MHIRMFCPYKSIGWIIVVRNKLNCSSCLGVGMLECTGMLPRECCLLWWRLAQMILVFINFDMPYRLAIMANLWHFGL